MAHDERPAPLLRLLQPLRRRDAAAGPRQQLRDALLRLGGRRSRVVPADLVLVHPAGRGDRRQEGVHHEPGRRRRPRDRHLPDVRLPRHRQLRRACSTASARCRRHGRLVDGPAAAARRVRQVRPVPAAGVVARRDGGPDPGLGAHPRGDDGHRRRLPDRPVQPDLLGQPDAADRRGQRRRADAADRLHHRRAPRTTSSGCSPGRRSPRSATCSSASGSAAARTRWPSSTCWRTASSRPACSSAPARSCTA